ncbi:Putative defective-in-cullin neddylation protein [Septoria linicola]|uniref:Defective in cullin neddylation protein n=1 Tax=Septoria linicola TaxID=215465 RepID=A0A9Q9APW8_9PEZI|nr:Putative defective-in-cullin neddylation protein [Septoria linicola]
MGKRKADTIADTMQDLTVATSKKVKKAGGRAFKEAALTSSQKTALAEFQSITQADKTTATKILKQSNWNTGAAVNIFFNNPSGGRPNPLQGNLSKVFDQYRDVAATDSPDEIGMDGTFKLCEDLQVSLEDVGALVLFELVGSPSLGSITREGFVDGWMEAGADTAPKMRNVVLQRRSALPTDRELFKNVYNHTFTLNLQERQKALMPEMAAELWKLLFTAPALEWRTQNSPWLEWWLEYNETKVKKAVNKDLWKQTLNFAQQTLKDESLSFWSEESSWPSVIDEFVEWVKTEKRTSNGDAMDQS